MTDQEVVLRLGLLFLLGWSREKCMIEPLDVAQREVFDRQRPGWDRNAVAETWRKSYFRARDAGFVS